MSLAIEEFKAQANSYNFYGSFFRGKPSADWLKSAIQFILTSHLDNEENNEESSGARDHFELAYHQLYEKVKQEGFKNYIIFLQKEYERLFFAPGRVPVDLFESVYRENRLLMQETTIAVRKHYLRAGLVVRSLYAIPDDHIATELEFMEFLSKELMESWEIEGSTAEIMRLESWRDEFLHEHLKQWLPVLAENIRTNTFDPFFQLLSFGLEALVEE